MRELSFTEVIKNIKKGQVWENERHRIIKGEYGINISHLDRDRKTNAIHFYEEEMFRLINE